MYNMEEYCTISYFIENANFTRRVKYESLMQHGRLQGSSCYDRMVVGFTITCVNVFYL